MPSLIEYKQKKALLEQLQKQLAAIENDPEFSRDLEFAERLSQLKEQYGKSDRDVINILNPRQTAPIEFGADGKRLRKSRPVKVFKNPHTGETVESKSLSHLTLKAWVREHGKHEVQGWVVETHPA